MMFYYVYAFELKINSPSCSSCKWFVPDKLGLNDYGLCKVFKNKYKYQFNNNNDNIVYEFAEHCRNNENMCGKSALFFEPIKNDISNDDILLGGYDNYDEETTISDLLYEYDDINNRCCGEVNETDELDEIERDLMNIFERLKNYYDKTE